MNKAANKRSGILIILFLLISILLIFSACGDDESSSQSSTPTTLAAPTVVLLEDTATWNANDSADKFEISLNGTLSYIENSITSMKLEEQQTFKIRAIGDGVNYSNSDWSNSVTYTKNTDTAKETFTVVWMNGATVIETDNDVAKGTFPSYDGAEPTKDADEQYSYAFSGWTPEIAEVNADVVYLAQFTSTINKYSVVWKNGDEVLETDVDVEYGATPTYDGEEPSKSATEQYKYTFKGWSPTIAPVVGDVTYEAEFNEIANQYTVTFYNEDGTKVLDSVTVNYGENAEYPKSTPIKNATDEYTYIFDKWVTERGGSVEAALTNIISDRSVYASFKAIARMVSVYIVSNNVDYGTVSIDVLDNVPYGSTIRVNENTVTINEHTVTAQTNSSTAQYSYAFDGWTTESIVGNDTVITANFSRSINKYTVTWKNGDSVIEIDENVSYGTMPVYNGETPTKSADSESIYIFSGWDPVISSITGDITYVAQFTNEANKHVVIFYDENGETELGRSIVGHGEIAVYPNELPTKQATEQYIYTFEKWVTEINGDTEAILTNIQLDVAVYAKYSQAIREYTVTFCDYDGTVLSKVNVAYGSAATAPTAPERDGYRFDGWSSAFDNVTAEMTVTAQYQAQVLVEFLDYDGSQIYFEYIDLGSDFINIPEGPIREYYKFSNWSVDEFTNIVEDLTVYAEYVRTYIVEFIDYDGRVIKSETVVKANAATAPDDPIREGYDFVGWQGTFGNVTSDLIIQATYMLKKYTVTFVMPDGKIIATASVRHGYRVNAPTPATHYFDWKTSKAYKFTSWSQSLEYITSDSTITAEYKEEVEGPVIVVDDRNSTISAGTTATSVSVFIAGNDKIYGINLDMNFAPELKGGTKAVTVDVSVQFGELDKQYTSALSDLGRYEWRWTEGNDGKTLSGRENVLTFNFSMKDDQACGDYIVDVLASTYVINENFEKVTPVIISGCVTIVD